tara:strand:- start:6501 stop:6719 length:219 start_codon:yes stop_codon:yes gene_type:complete
MKLLKYLRCINCIKRKKNSKLYKLKNKLSCRVCGENYPIFKNIPIMLSEKGDFFHLRKALMPAKYRVKKYGS